MPHFHRNYPYLLVSIFLTAEDGLSYESIRDSSFISQESDCVLMIKRDKDRGETAAKLSVEFHRRTGVWEKMIDLKKENGYLVEVAGQGE